MDVGPPTDSGLAYFAYFTVDVTREGAAAWGMRLRACETFLEVARAMEDSPKHGWNARSAIHRQATRGDQIFNVNGETDVTRLAASFAEYSSSRRSKKATWRS